MAENDEKSINPDKIINSENDDDIIDMIPDDEVNKEQTKESSDERKIHKYSGLSNIDRLLETNITEWDYESAKNYVIEFIKVANQYKDDFIEKIKQLKKWANRIELARDNNKPELVKEAESQFTKLSQEAEYLENEYKKMKMHVEVLKEQLAQKKGFIPKNDPSILLHKLENILKKDTDEVELEEKLKKASLEEKLESLKKKISKDDNLK